MNERANRRGRAARRSERERLRPARAAGIRRRIGTFDILDDEAFALDAIAEVGPGAHFLDSDHTRAHFRNAFYQSTGSDDGPFEQWRAEGSKDAAVRANAEWKRRLKAYEDPGLDPGVDEGLREYVEKRKREMPDVEYL